MCKLQNVTRAHGTYYYRRLIRLGTDQPFRLRLSLRTTCWRRARLLAPAMTLIAERLMVTMTAKLTLDGLTAQQRAEIFRRQMLIERDRLEAMHASLYVVARCDYPDAEEALELRLGISGMAAADGIAKGVVEDFLVATSPISDDPSMPIEAMLWSDLAETMADEGAEAQASSRLVDLGIEPTQLREVMARKVVNQARLSALEEFRRALSDPSASYAPVPLDAFNMVAVPLPSMGAETSPAVSGHGPWGTLTPTQAAAKFFEHNPRTGGLDGKSIKRGRKGWTPKTREQFMLAAQFLEEVMEGRPLAAVTHDDLVTLDGCFGWIHAKSFRKSERDRHKTIVEIADETRKLVDKAEKAEEKKRKAKALPTEKANTAITRDSVGLSVATTNRHWSFLRQLTRWFHDHHPLARLDYNAFIAADKRNARDMRERFTVEQGLAIFHLPPWTGAKSLARRMTAGDLIVHDAFYFVPMIAWYSGMRRDEICGMELSDIEKVDGHWQFRVRPNETRGLKNTSSDRMVPIADELIRLGLADYVAALKAEGETQLFPELVSIAGKASMGDVFYKRMWVKIAAAVPDLTHKQSIHSFRHTAIDTMKGAGIAPEIRADFAGHALSSETEGRYSKAHLDLLREAVSAIPNVTASLASAQLRLLPAKMRSSSATGFKGSRIR
ncbi:tyrosine-type recombinase/integrase [Altererythrobacter aerius]|uniref:Tyrosine-type recombinase/integrase n=2 Tax=Tsuneonella aeria TaxID=1837929 RepID=A0A6I4TJH0_9SPHN|nr:tyrosine-type recombinase/integrase [Tsuneonella aeria]